MSTSLLQIERLLGELADRDQRPVDRDRADRDVDARAVEQARVAQRMRFVDAAADRRDDLVDDAQEMRLVLEAHRGGLQNAAALHIDAFVAVDQNVVDAAVLEQRLDRAEAGHLVENFVDELGELLGIQRQTLDQDVLRDELLDVLADFVLGQLFERRKVDLLDQLAVQPHLGVEQLVGQQRIGCGRRGGGGGRLSGQPSPARSVRVRAMGPERSSTRRDRRAAPTSTPVPASPMRRARPRSPENPARRGAR